MTLDLSNLEGGEYLLTVIRANKSYSQALTIGEFGKVKIGEMEEITKPVLTQKEGSFIVTNPNATVKNVSIYNKKGSLLYEKKYAKKEGKAKRVIYDLKKAKTGTYTVKISTNDGIYYEEIIVK